MSKLLLFYVTGIVAKMLFLIVPNNDVTVGYLFSDMTVSLEFYIWSLFEKLFLIALAYVVANEATEYREALHIFLWLVIADTADMLLSYNSIWFHIGTLPVSMNTLSVFVFGLVILKEWTKKHITEY